MYFYKLLLFLILMLPLRGIAQPVNPSTPPEYFPSKAVLMEWDFNQYTWSLYADLIRECRLATAIILVVRDQNEEDQMRNLITAEGIPLSGITFAHVPCERMWIRDHGPLAVQTDQGVAFMDFDDLANSGLDENLPTNLANLWGIDAYNLPYVFCGGNFMVDSYDRLYTTSRVYSNNPAYSKAQIDQVFEDYLGITEIVTFSPQHDDYWGHIDMQLKLLDDTTFVLSEVNAGSGPEYDSLEANYARLQALTGPHGKPYRIGRLPMAEDWKTYANSLILNDRIIVPTYDHPFDSLALATYAQLMPGYDVVGVDCNKIIGWEGALHCITMQLFDEAQIAALRSVRQNDAALSVYPNPVKEGEIVYIRYSESDGTPCTLNVYDMQGRIISTLHWDGSDVFRLPWPFPSGAYVLELIHHNENRYIQRLMVE